MRTTIPCPTGQRVTPAASALASDLPRLALAPVSGGLHPPIQRSHPRLRQQRAGSHAEFQQPGFVSEDAGRRSRPRGVSAVPSLDGLALSFGARTDQPLMFPAVDTSGRTT